MLFIIIVLSVSRHPALDKKHARDKHSLLTFQSGKRANSEYHLKVLYNFDNVSFNEMFIYD